MDLMYNMAIRVPITNKTEFGWLKYFNVSGNVCKQLMRTGNMITKKKIQGTKCSLEYEKVNHGAKNNRDGPAKVKTY